MSGWTLSEFRRDIQSADPDFHIVALEALGKYLPTVETLVLSEKDLKWLVWQVMGRADDGEDHLDIAFIKLSVALRAIVLLAGRIQEEYLAYFIGEVISKPFDDQCSITEHYRSILKEIITNSLSGNETRQVILKTTMLPLLLEKLKMENASYIEPALEVLTALTETLGFLFTPADIQEVYEQLKGHLTEDFAGYASLITNLSVAWCGLAGDELFTEYIALVFERMGECSICLPLITACVLHNPAAFAPYINELLGVFYPTLGYLDVTDEEVTDYQIQLCDGCLRGIDAIISAFPDAFTETAEFYCDIVFKYIDYGASTPDLTSDSTMDAGNEFDMDLDDSNVDVRDSTWKIRKAVHILAQTLIRKYPDTFYAKFNEEENKPKALVLISDCDAGAKATSVQVLLLIARTYKSTIGTETIKTWVSKLANELLDEDESLVAIVLPVLTDLVNEFKVMPPKYLARSIKNLTTRIPGCISETLRFLSSLISSAEGITAHTVEITEILSAILAKNKEVAMCVEVAAELYYYVPNPSAEAMQALVNLNKKIMELAVVPSDKQAAAIYTLTVFAAVYPENAATAECIATIIKPIQQESCAKAVCNALSLIGASNASGALASIVESIMEPLKGHLIAPEPALVVRSLWALLIGLEKGVFKPESCESLMDGLANIIETGDSRAKLLALKIAKNLGNLPSITSTIIPVINKVMIEQKLNHKAVAAAAEVFYTTPMDIVSLVDGLAQKGTSMDAAESVSIDDAAIATNIAFFCNKILDKNLELKGQVVISVAEAVAAGAIDVFKLRLLGEIGATNPIAIEELINGVLALVDSEERKVFTAAAECIGLLSAGSLDGIFPMFTAKVMSDSQRISVWLIAINRFLKAIKKKAESVDLTDLGRYLLANADSEKETSGMFIDCLKRLVAINPDFTAELIANVTLREKSSPVAARALAGFIGSCTEEKAGEILEQLLPYIDPAHPATTAGIILCYKECIKFTGLELMLVGAIGSVMACLATSPSQFVDVFYGAERRTVDLGRLMRINTIDTISILFKTMPQNLDMADIVHICIPALRDPRSEVQRRVISFLSAVCEDTVASRGIKTDLNISDLTATLEDLDADMTDESELIEPYLMFLARLHFIFKASVPNFQRVYGKHQKKERMVKIENDAQFAMAFSAGVKQFQLQSVPYILMTKLWPAAAEVFAKQ